jgi:hypothetical protein
MMVEHTRSILDEEHLPLAVATRQLGPNAPDYNQEWACPTAVATRQLGPNADQNQEWACPTCTLLNPINVHVCDACSSPITRYSSEASVNAGGELEFYAAPVLEGNGTDASENKFAYRQLCSDDSTTNANQNIGEDEGENLVIVEDLGENPMAKKRRRRERRRARMVVGGTGGLVVGTIISAGPAGVILAAVGGVTATRAISKRRELKKDERVAQARLAAAYLD